jgi:hypothetical protein
MVEKAALIGLRDKIVDDFSAWAASPVTPILISGTAERRGSWRIAH